MTIRAATRFGPVPMPQIPAPAANPRNGAAEDHQQKSRQTREGDALFALPLNDEDDGTYPPVPPFRGPNDSLS
jgi:hypothetical protein